MILYSIFVVPGGRGWGEGGVVENCIPGPREGGKQIMFAVPGGVEGGYPRATGA